VDGAFTAPRFSVGLTLSFQERESLSLSTVVSGMVIQGSFTAENRERTGTRRSLEIGDGTNASQSF
jgi:hypothetical protein